MVRTLTLEGRKKIELTAQRPFPPEDVPASQGTGDKRSMIPVSLGLQELLLCAVRIAYGKPSVSAKKTGSLTKKYSTSRAQYVILKTTEVK